MKPQEKRLQLKARWDTFWREAPDWAIFIIGWLVVMVGIAGVGLLMAALTSQTVSDVPRIILAFGIIIVAGWAGRSGFDRAQQNRPRR